MAFGRECDMDGPFAPRIELAPHASRRDHPHDPGLPEKGHPVSRHHNAPGRRESGFILGGAVAHQLSAGFIPIRKKGKLPHATVSIPYSLEYGLDHMEMHEDAVTKGERVILVDDLIATGGTAEGAVKLLRQMGAEVVAACFVIDLPDLGGAAKLEALNVSVRSLVTFPGH
jgi:adenine phosphoribosyltransferase